MAISPAVPHKKWIEKVDLHSNYIYNDECVIYQPQEDA